jgi:TetR/AcrR family fatty acid metabolism transcriptional regulator
LASPAQSGYNRGIVDAVVKDVPKRRRREETRERLLEAATSVFAQHGFDRSTVDEVVREAGFSKGAFYVHFESKEDLFWAMLEERIDRQHEAFKEAVDFTKPVSDNVMTILHAVFDLVEDDPFWGSLFMEFGAHAARNEKVRERLAGLYDRWRELLVAMLTAGRDAGRIRPDIDIGFTTTVLIATVEGAVIQSRLSPDSVRLKDLLEPLTALFVQLLAPTAE